nr:hypothetical protein [Tanacetum cinerariifolium]GEZ95746.1 hypothetical protein [Tanacetum cinerariifolium]
IIMPKSIYVDHYDTAFYIPKYHRTEGLNEQEREIYKNFELTLSSMKDLWVRPARSKEYPLPLILSKLKVNLKKWETILSENVISLIGNKDHPNAYLCYMFFSLTIRKPSNFAYYIAKRMESVTKSDIIALPYGMLLTHLFKHVHISHPFAIIDNHYLVDHVMIPLSERQVFKIMPKGKRPHLQTPSLTESFESPSPTPYQEEEENEPINNYTLVLFPTSINFHTLKEESHRNSSKQRKCLSALVIFSLT